MLPDMRTKPPVGMRTPMPVEPRFWKKVDKSGECWLWTGARASNGYGHLWVGGRFGKQVAAHRLSYEMHHGPVPDGYFVCHKCDVKACVRPDHLEAGPPAKNSRDAVDRGLFPKTNPKARKLSDEQIATARERYLRGEVSLRALGAEYGVSHRAFRIYFPKGIRRPGQRVKG